MDILVDGDEELKKEREDREQFKKIKKTLLTLTHLLKLSNWLCVS